MGIVKVTIHTTASPALRTFAYPEELDAASREAGWKLEHYQLKPGRFSARSAVRQGRYIQVMREYYGSDLEIQGVSPKGMLKIGVVRHCGRQASSPGNTLDQASLIIALPDTQLCMTFLGVLECDCICIPQQMLHEVEVDLNAMFAWGFASGLIRVDVSGPALSRWRRTFSAALLAVANDLVSRQEHEISLLQQTVTLLGAARTVFACLRTDLSFRRNAELARIREYFDANLASPIKVDDVSDHAGIPVRNLQRLCKRELGLTPTQYLLARRLNAVRRALIDSEVASGRVTPIAAHYGFDHLGRFAVQYRKFFGETPRQTLHKSPAPLMADWLQGAA